MAVIVTYNRKELLAETLKCFDNLESPPNTIIIVDNNSNDGTENVVAEWTQRTKYKDVHYLRLEENIGGSGGFHTGLKHALKMNPDWVWLSDDDAFPEKNCFTYIRNKINNIDADKFSAICCAVINNGVIDKSHRRRILNHKIFLKKERCVPVNEYNGIFELDLFSYVGVVINCKKLKLVGLTLKDYFIWNDDTEHSWRLRKVGKIICIPDAKIYHNTPPISHEITWKTFYGERNKLIMYKKHAYLTYLKMLYEINKRINKTYSPQEKNLLKSVLSAVHEERMGLDEMYKPGWKP